MKRTLVGLCLFVVVLAAGTTVLSQTTMRSALHDYRLVTFVDALVQPWSIAFLPGGDILITQRPGRLRIVRQGKLVAQPVEGVPTVFHSSQGGLLEVVPHPNFATNRLNRFSVIASVRTHARADRPARRKIELIRNYRHI